MEYEIGQDVVVESDSILNGEAFIGSVDVETETVFGDGVIVDTQERDALPSVVQVSTDEVLTLTNVFESLK